MTENFEIPVREGGEDGGGHRATETHLPCAAPVAGFQIAGLRVGEGEADHLACVPRDHGFSVGLATTIDAIREEWRHRQAWHRAEKSLTLQAKALCRRLATEGDKAEADRIYRAILGKGEHPMAAVAAVSIMPLDAARKVIANSRKAAEKRLTRLAGDLPVAPWVNATRGVGLLSLAAVIGEAGDLGGYANPAKLWKRLGLAVIDGGRQRKVAGLDALRHGYSPARRSVVWNIGSCIVKAGGPLKALYDARKVVELVKCEAVAADPAERARYTRGARYAPKLHAHNRAQRYVEKRILRDLWSAWRRETGVRDAPPIRVPAAPD